MSEQNPQEKARIMVGISSNRNPEWKTIMMVQQAMQYASQHGITTTLVPRLGDSLISRSRNDLLMDFMDNQGFEKLVTIDDDITPPIDFIVRMNEQDKDILGGIYRLKQSDTLFAIRTLTGERPSLDYFREVILKGDPVPIKYVSTGCLMIKRSAFERMIEAYPDLGYDQNLTGRKQYGLYIPFIYNREYLSEDWALCQRALDCGLQVFMDPKVLCGHIGKTEFRIKGV